MPKSLPGPALGPAAELSPRRRMLVLGICCISLLLVSLDITILNVALPSMQRDFGASVSGLQWTIDAYLVVLASLLMLAGSTGDRVGRKRIFQIGLMLFSLGSLLCSLAPGLSWLIGFRMLQAVGGSMLNPVAMSIITNTFSEPKERARAIGVFGGAVGVSMAAGPIIGGALVESVGWRSIFWINLPVGIAALVLTACFIPESRAPRPRRVDPVGQFLVIAMLGALTYGIIEGSSAGWTSPLIIGCFVLAALSVAGMAVYERRRVDPLIDIRFFRSVPFTGATLIAMSLFAALGGFLFLNTLYLQNERGLSALGAGLYVVPMALMCLVMAPVSGRLIGTRGPRVPLVLAGISLTTSGVLFAAMDAESSNGLLFTSYVLFGTGVGLVNPPITNTAVSGMPPAQAGLAAAIASTSRQVGQSLGVAVLGAALAAGMNTGAWWIITGCGASVLVLGVVTTGRWARGTAERTAGLLMAEPEEPLAAVSA